MVPPPPPSQYPEQSQATTALVLGILSLVCCGVLGPFAWNIGQTELRAIDEGRRPPQNRSTANAGKILGIIATVFLGVVLLWLFLLGGLAIVSRTVSTGVPG